MILTTIQDNLYLCWQAELLHWNCRKRGRDCTIIIGHAAELSPHALRLQQRCGAVLLPDTRTDLCYAPSIQPHLLSKYSPAGPTPVLLCDSDVLFKTFDNIPATDGRAVYASDCGSYLNAAYVDGCDPELLHHLCTISHIPPEYVRERRTAPGAQYILPHLFETGFWQRIEENSTAMYKLMAGYTCAIHPVQVWTASMWAIWFELLRQEMAGNITVATDPRMTFAWATDQIRRWAHTDILHMAGVTRDMSGYFHKGDYTERPPWDCDLSHVLPGNCSYIYAQAIEEYRRTLP